MTQETKKILLIITGSVAAYKSMDLVRLLKKKSYDVTCVLTKSACEFITPLLASSLSQNKTYTELFEADEEIEMGHINLSRQADLILVAPATANFIAKIANGVADDLASTTLLAANKKIMMAPAMNEKMWDNAQTQDNLQKCIKSDIAMVEPQSDILACGEYGVGKMAEPETIVENVEQYFLDKEKLKGKNILITGGATFEPIDPVRFIGNHSSGKQAIALAKTFSEMGAKVTLVAANIKDEIPLPKDNIITVKTADEMFESVKENLDSCNLFIACAAVSDYKVKNFTQDKIKKSSNNDLTLELVQNVDILKYVGNCENRPQSVIGFAAEGKNIEQYATDKLTRKNCDLIVANDIEGGSIFGDDQTKVLFVQKDKIENFGKISKSELARKLANKINDI